MPECFSIPSDEVENRIDPHFYRPAFIQFYQQLEKTQFELKTIGEIAEKVTSGATPLSHGDAYTSKEEGIPFIRSGDINEDKNINFDEVLYIKENTHNKLLKGSKLKKGDVLIAIVGATIGQVSIYDYDKEANINQAIALVRLKQEINPEYIKAFMISTLGQKQLDRIKRPVARANINLDEIRGIKIILPSLTIQNKIVALMDNAYKEQKNKENKIAEFLDSINDYVLDELGIKLPELKDKMIYAISFDRLQNKRADAYYYQPKFEEVERAVREGKFEVKELKEYITKIHYGASVKNEYIDEGIPLLRIMNLKPNKFDLRDVVKLPETMKKELGNAFVKEGDLLISRSGTVGVVSVVPKEAEGFAFGSFMIEFCLNEKVNKNYISAWLNTKLQKLLTERDKIGAIQGNITIETIENFKIPLPPLAVQNKIAEEVIKQMQKAEQLQKESKEELRKVKMEVEKIILG
ncbi:MAG: restriction endonuclease subunit S [Candidatus Nanoarchaeia archaeon]|nr:restriction endonuclease subunit S [Candidatus Nanoarchaeia archaeon]